MPERVASDMLRPPPATSPPNPLSYKERGARAGMRGYAGATLFAQALPSQGRVAEGREGSLRPPATSPPARDDHHEGRRPVTVPIH